MFVGVGVVVVVCLLFDFGFAVLIFGGLFYFLLWLFMCFGAVICAVLICLCWFVGLDGCVVV